MKIKLKYGKNEDKDKIIKKIEKDLKINLVAKTAEDIVNGYIESRQTEKDMEIDVILYDEDKDPDFEIYEYNGVTYNRGSKVTKRKFTIDKEEVKDLGSKAYDII